MPERVFGGGVSGMGDVMNNIALINSQEVFGKEFRVLRRDFMLKCKICGTEFPPVKESHYVGRENEIVWGLAYLSNGKEESQAYDCFDCPMCGCQVIAQERKRAMNL